MRNKPKAPAHICTTKPELKDARTRAQGGKTLSGVTRRSPPRAEQERQTWGQGPPHTPRAPRSPSGAWERNIGGHRLVGRYHRRYCTYGTDTWDHKSDSTGKNHAKRDAELCVRQGAKGKGKGISIFLEGTAPGLAHPGHSTRTTTSNRTTTSTPSTNRDDHMDDHQMCEHQLQ